MTDFVITEMKLVCERAMGAFVGQAASREAYRAIKRDVERWRGMSGERIVPVTKPIQFLVTGQISFNFIIPQRQNSELN